MAAVANASRMLGQLSGFETRYDADSPEVRVHALPQSPPAAGCTDGSVTCWFGATDCTEAAEVLLDPSGAPVLDQYGQRSFSFCPRRS